MRGVSLAVVVEFALLIGAESLGGSRVRVLWRGGAPEAGQERTGCLGPGSGPWYDGRRVHVQHADTFTRMNNSLHQCNPMSPLVPLRHLSAAQRAEASRIMDAHTRPEALTRLLKRVPDVYNNEIKMRFLRAIAVALATREPAPNPIHDAKAIVAIDAVDTAHAVSTTALRLLVASLTFLAARPDATEQLMQQIERIVSTVPFTPDTEQRAFRRMLIEHIRKAVEPTRYYHWSPPSGRCAA